MSLRPLFPNDAEPDSSAPAEEPRLLTRTQPYTADPASERHRLHAVEHPTKLSSDAAPARPRLALASAVAHLRRHQLHDQQTVARESRSGSRWLVFILGLVLLTGLLGVGLSLWLRHAMHAALPVIDGTLHVAGLQANVQVTRDAQGVPSLTAASLDDLIFAQGFVTAQDRLWQMDALRRNAAGELAEVLGSSLVEHDRRQRLLQIRAAADRAVAALAPDQLAQLDAYARGVNAAMVDSADRLPIEFRLLHYKPAPWTPRDSLLISLSMAQDLGTGFPQKLSREALSAHLAPAVAAQLYPTGSWRDRQPTQAPVDLTTPREVPEIPLDPSQSGFARLDSPTLQTKPADLLAITDALRPCADCRAGSNNWAVAASRSASGAPLLSNDMHLSLSAPDIWYETSLHLVNSPSASSSSAFDVTGFSLPGVPFVIVGRNAHVAWGFTNLGGDVQDLRIEHVRGTGSATEYQRPDGTWAMVGHHPERIRVRGGRDVLLDVLTTTAPLGNATLETPIISPLYPSEHRALSLAWTVYDPAVLTSPFLAANQAVDGPSLIAALGSFGAPSLNLVWADTAGHIGYHAIGRIPVRGPAIHHPRAVETLVLPDRDPNQQEDQEDETAPATSQGTAPKAPDASAEPQASLSSPSFGPTASYPAHLALAAFRPVRRPSRAPSRDPARQPAPQPRSSRLRARPKRAAAGVNPAAARHAAAKPAVAKAAVTESVIAPAAAALDYTIGSPLSAVPVDALDAAQQWSGYIPFSDLPSAQDPAGGVLATANSRVTADDYPYALTLDWVDPYRAERIYKLLEGRHKLTPTDMLAAQNDIHSELDLTLAQRVAYALDHASDAALGSHKASLHQAADLLRNWKGNVRSTEAAPAIVSAIRADLLPTLLAGQVAAHDGLRPNSPEAFAWASLYSWNASGTALELLLLHSPRAWLPPGFSSWNDFLALVTVHALEHAHAPGDLTRWTYGSLHTLEIDHPLLGTHAPLQYALGVRGSSGRYPADGDYSTVKAMGRQFGPSERFTADLAAPDATFGNLTTGQSGNPSSPWFMDQFLPWLRGTTLALPLQPTGASHTLTLTP